MTAEPKSVTFPSLVAQIENGSIKIPQFQRKFVWKRSQSGKLIDSILKGYPIGTFILWKTADRLRSIRNLGGIDLPEPPDGDRISYVLDGQQRLTSLFVSLKALQVTLDDEIRDYALMNIDLLANEEKEVVSVEEIDNFEQRYILLSELLKGDFAYLASFPQPQSERIRLYQNRIESYQFSIIEVSGAEIEVATEIFTRLNIGGKALTVFEIMVAKTYDHPRSFDLTEKVAELDALLVESGFGEIPPATVLQIAAACLAKDVTSKSILRLPKERIIDHWEEIIHATLRAVEYLRIELRVPVINLLPFPGLLIAFASFFNRTNDDRATAAQRKLLNDFFWRVSLAGRYSSSLESRANQDLQKIGLFVEEKPAEYEWPVDYSAKFIEQNGYFSTGRSFTKALLCLLAAEGPKSFESGASVTVRNNWLLRANSKNYHHFFPKSYMERRQPEVEWWRVNHIANITFVDDYLNKRVIGSKPPSTYLGNFMQKDPDLDLSPILFSHLISSEHFTVGDDDYGKFFTGRCEMISERLGSSIIAQSIDGEESVSTQAEDDLED